MKRTTFVVPLFVLAVACSGASHHALAPSKTTLASNGQTTVTTQLRRVAVSSTCGVAMHRLIGIGRAIDPFANGIPSGLAAQAFERSIASTLTHCASEAEWLTAAEAAAHTADVFSVLKRFCGFRFTDVPRVIPVNAASCAEVPGTSGVP